MRVSNYLKEEFCVMDLKATSMKAAISEITEALAAEDKLVDKEKFVKDVLEREALGSTGIGNKVAIPHARTEAVRGLVIGFGRSTAGIDFHALDGDNVNLVFLMGADPGELNRYLRILAELSKLLMNASFRKAVAAAKTAKDVIAALTTFEKSS